MIFLLYVDLKSKINIQLSPLKTKTWPGWIANILDDFQVGNEMVANGIKRCQMITYMVTLAAVTPIGMIIGIILTIHVDAQSGIVRCQATNLLSLLG